MHGEQLNLPFEPPLAPPVPRAEPWSGVRPDQKRWIDEKLAELGLRHASAEEMGYLVWRALGDWLGPSEFWLDTSLVAAYTVLSRVMTELRDHPPRSYSWVTEGPGEPSNLAQDGRELGRSGPPGDRPV